MVYLVSDKYCADLSVIADVLCQLLSFAQQFESYVLNLTLSLFSKYPDMFVSGKVNSSFLLNFLDSAELTSSQTLITG